MSGTHSFQINPDHGMFQCTGCGLTHDGGYGHKLPRELDQCDPPETGPGEWLHFGKVVGGMSEQQPRYGGRCINCRARITAQTAAEWHRKVKAPCPRCGKPW